MNLGDLDLILGDYGRAEAMAREGLAVFREVGDRRGIAISLSNIGCAALYQDRAADAVAPLRESLEVSAELGDGDGVAYCLDALAAAAAAAGDWERSARLSGAADGLRTRAAARSSRPKRPFASVRSSFSTARSPRTRSRRL